MTCPVCKRELAPTISICYACGTMVHDSVREELQTKVAPISNPLEKQIAVKAAASMNIEETVFEVTPPEIDISIRSELQPAPVRQPRSEPTDRISRHTSPTLVDFQNKNSAKPDWRIQLQNAVQQRKTDVAVSASSMETSGFQTHLATNGAAALKAQFVPEPEMEVSSHANPRVAKALRRIEESRRRFESGGAPAIAKTTPAPAKNYPFNVVSRSGDISPDAAPRATVNTPPKPRLVSSMKIEKKGFDTNKLPPLPVAAPSPVQPQVGAKAVAEPAAIPEWILADDITIEEPVETVVSVEPEIEEYDDLAPLSSRFTAGLFDVIIGGFATAVLTSPLLLSGGSWLSIAGILTLSAAFGIVMFTYLTATIGLRGRTLGMRLFGLEVVDVEDNEYPTVHQAAVNSAVFLLSFPFLGIGFVPAFLNDERRAFHDLVSGTVLVREV